MQPFISPTQMLDTIVTPDLLYSVGVTLKPAQETALIGKLKLVLGRRIARAVWHLLSPQERHDIALLSDYASRDAIQRWLEEHTPGLDDLLRLEGMMLKAELLVKAAELQVSGGERGVPDWVEYAEEQAA